MLNTLTSRLEEIVEKAQNWSYQLHECWRTKARKVDLRMHNLWSGGNCLWEFWRRAWIIESPLWEEEDYESRKVSGFCKWQFREERSQNLNVWSRELEMRIWNNKHKDLSRFIVKRTKKWAWLQKFKGGYLIIKKKCHIHAY